MCRPLRDKSRAPSCGSTKTRSKQICIFWSKTMPTNTLKDVYVFPHWNLLTVSNRAIALSMCQHYFRRLCEFLWQCFLFCMWIMLYFLLKRLPYLTLPNRTKLKLLCFKTTTTVNYVCKYWNILSSWIWHIDQVLKCVSSTLHSLSSRGKHCMRVGFRSEHPSSWCKTPVGLLSFEMAGYSLTVCFSSI